MDLKTVLVVALPAPHKGATVRPDLFQYPLWRSR